MVKLSFLTGALLAAAANAFVPPATPAPRIGTSFVARSASSVPTQVNDPLGNNIAVKNLLLDIESSGLLTKVARSGLLSKAKEAGVSLSKLEPLLELAAENPDILVLVEASGPELLPVLPTIVDIAPGALPLLASAVTVPAGVLQAGALASVLGAGAAVAFIPDDTTVEIAAQTLIVGTLGLAAPAALLAGSAILSKLTK